MARVHFPAWELKIFKCAFPFTLNFSRDGFPFFHQDHSQFPVLKDPFLIENILSIQEAHTRTLAITHM